MAQFIPKRYCNSFATTTKNAEDAVEWHRLVTRAQHINWNRARLAICRTGVLDLYGDVGEVGEFGQSLPVMRRLAGS